VRDDAPELGPIAFYFHEGAAELGLLLSLCKCFLEQTPEAVLLPLNPEHILNFLACARAWNANVQEHTSHDFVARESACSCEVFEVSRVRVSEPHSDSMFQIPHPMSISIAIALSRRNVVSHARISRRR